MTKNILLNIFPDKYVELALLKLIKRAKKKEENLSQTFHYKDVNIETLK